MAWDENLSESYNRLSPYMVPEREFQHRTMVSLIPHPEGPFNLLELCCGEGLLAAQVLQSFPHCTVYGMDGSPAMLNAAHQRLAHFGGRFQPVPFDLPSSDWRKPPFPVHAVLSSLAIHHLDEAQKTQLFQDVFQLLSPGGVFIVADIILPESEQGLSYAAAALDEIVRERSLELDGNLDVLEFFQRERWNYFRYPEDPLDRPSSLLAQLHWLKQAGFRQVDVYWMLAGHAIFGGVRPAGDPPPG